MTYVEEWHNTYNKDVFITEFGLEVRFSFAILFWNCADKDEYTELKRWLSSHRGRSIGVLPGCNAMDCGDLLDHRRFPVWFVHTVIVLVIRRTLGHTHFCCRLHTRRYFDE